MAQGVGERTVLNDMVTAIQTDIAANDMAAACAGIRDFKKAAKPGKHISPTSATHRDEADRLAASLGC